MKKVKVRDFILRKTVVFISMILILCTLVGCIEDNEECGLPSRIREYPEWAEFTVERTITISPRNPSTPMSYMVDIPTPRDIPLQAPGLQEVRSVVADPNTRVSQYSDYEWMFWEAENVTGTNAIWIRYSIRSASHIWTLDPSESGTVEDIPEWLRNRYGNQMTEEWRILPNHPNIIEESNRLTINKDNVYEKLKAIFDWMQTSFQYENQNTGSPRLCYETLQTRRGDAHDQSVLFCSLARAAGLPAWLEFGPLYNRVLDSWEGHVWVRVYIPNSNSGGEVYNIDIVNDHFLFRDPFRFTEWESDGNGEHLEDYYSFTGTNVEFTETYRTIDMETSSETIP